MLHNRANINKRQRHRYYGMGDRVRRTEMLGAVVPKAIADKALSYLDAPLREVYERWRSYCMWYTPIVDD